MATQEETSDTVNNSELDLYGQDFRHAELKAGYAVPEHFSGQGDFRTIKALLFPVHVKQPNPMHPDGPDIIQERLHRRGDRVHVKELGLISLEKGERLNAFYTDAELQRDGKLALSSGDVALDEAPNYNEWGEHELAEWIKTESPSVNDILEIVGTDKDFAQRMLAAENEATDNDPRKTLVDGLTRIIQDANQ